MTEPTGLLRKAVVGHTRHLVSVTKCVNEATGETGWYVNIGNYGAWISDRDADQLARTMLFEEDAP